MNSETGPNTHQGLSPKALGPNQQAAVDQAKENEYINEKFSQLLKKIDLQKKGQPEGTDENEPPQEEPESIYNKDKALKELYDESVSFKNSLAELRSNIKSLNSQFKAYDQKC